MIIGSSGDTEEEALTNHNWVVHAVLDRLQREELVESVSKTDFFFRSMEFCGHVLEQGTRWPAPGKMLALDLGQNWILLVSSGGFGAPRTNIIRDMSKTTPP